MRRGLPTLALLSLLPAADVSAWLQAIQSVDRSILQSNTPPPVALPAALKPRLPELSSPARVLAARVLTKSDTPEAASLLLVLVQDPDSSVAAAAGNGLLASATTPPPVELLRAIPALPNPALRAQLYLVAGKSAADLPALRKLLAAESAPAVRPSALAAIVRRGGVPERAALAKEVANANGPAIATILDLVAYTGEKQMGFALQPLFGSAKPVKQLTADPVTRVASRSDYAVWTAHRLGLLPGLRITKLDNFDASIVARARAACARQ